MALVSEEKAPGRAIPYYIRSYRHRNKQQMEAGGPPPVLQHRHSLPTRRATRSNTATSARLRNESTTNYGEASSLEVWQVARAATAAPAYFKPLKVYVHPKCVANPEYSYFLDGGFGYNNPTAEGITEIERLHGIESLDMVVSVGTAKKEARPKSWLRAIKVGIDSISRWTDPEDTHRAVLQRSKRDSFQYVRLNDPETLEIPLDEWKSTTLRNIRNNFNSWAQRLDNIRLLEQCAQKLVDGRRLRWKSDRSRWERFATGSCFFCPHLNCDSDFIRREDFTSHAVGHDAYKNLPMNESWIANNMSRWKYREGRPRPNIDAA
jgi:hypothetical protein